MSTLAKQRIVAVVLAACALWPAAHFALARHYDFDPWNLFGWAMYTVPDPRIELTFAEVTDGQARRIVLPPQLTERAKQWADRRSALGGLTSPDRLAGAVLAARPEIDGVLIGVRKWVLDPRTGMVVPRDEVHRYRR